MSRFSSSFIPFDYTPLDSPGDYQISGNVIDNNARYIASDAQTSDVIYINTSANGGPLCTKYIITSIVDNTQAPLLIVTVRQVSPDPIDGALDPYGYEGLIGNPDLVGIIQLVDWRTQDLSTAFLTAIQNYQTDLMNKAVLTICNNIIAPISGGTGKQRTLDANYFGSLDGVNQVFYTAAPFVADSTVIIYNGVTQKRNIDYAEQSSNSIYTFFVPQLGDTLTIDVLEQ